MLHSFLNSFWGMAISLGFTIFGLWGLFKSVTYLNTHRATNGRNKANFSFRTFWRPLLIITAVIVFSPLNWPFTWGTYYFWLGLRALIGVYFFGICAIMAGIVKVAHLFNTH